MKKKEKKKVKKAKKVPYLEKAIPDSELLKLACEFDMGPEAIHNGRYKWWEKFPRDARSNHIYIKNMGNPDDGPDHWGIFREGMSSCLNKDGQWQYQGMPSSRTDDFYDHCRYASVYEAIEYYRRWYNTIAEWAEEKVADAPDKDHVVLNWDQCPNIPKFQ